MLVPGASVTANENCSLNELTVSKSDQILSKRTDFGPTSFDAPCTIWRRIFREDVQRRCIKLETREKRLKKLVYLPDFSGQDSIQFDTSNLKMVYLKVC